MEARATRKPRMGRLEPAAIAGVMSREVANFRTFWKSTAFSSLMEPVIYLLAFGLGLGATLVSSVDGLDYVQFVGTGMVATAVIFSSAFPAMFGTFVKHRFQNTYDAILAAPVDTEELVTAEMLWISLRAGLFGVFPLLVTMLFGLEPTPGMLLVPLLRLRHRAQLRRRRHRRRGDRAEDRPVQLRDDSRRHAAVPDRRHFLSDRPAARSGRRCWRSSTRCTSSSSWSAAPASASSPYDLLRFAGLDGRSPSSPGGSRSAG